MMRPGIAPRPAISSTSRGGACRAAPQEIRKAAKTTAGNGQAFAQKPAGPAGAVPGTKAAKYPSARLRILDRVPSGGRSGAGGSVVGSLIGRVVYHAPPREQGYC